MLPPAPSATIAYKSPNACNICHADKDAAWGDTYVREWRTRDYQAPLLKRAALIDAARKRDWSKLPEMLAYIQGKDRDEVFATSLIRLISTVQDQKVLAALLTAAKDPSPLRDLDHPFHHNLVRGVGEEIFPIEKDRSLARF